MRHTKLWIHREPEANQSEYATSKMTNKATATSNYYDSLIENQ